MTRTRLFTALCLFLLSSALCRAQQKTLISDTLFQADGSRASGSATISWPAFTSPDNFPIAQGTLTINIANGSISVQLVPTIGATPAGTSYTVAYFLTNSVSYTEYWTVPTTGPVTLTQVRTTPVPVPTTTFGEHQLTLGNGLQAQLGLWRQSAAPVATAEGQCYWDLPTHAIKCTDQTLSFNALGGSDPTRVSKAGDTMTGSLLASNTNVTLGSSSKPFGAIFQQASGPGLTFSQYTLNNQGENLAMVNPLVGNDPNERRAVNWSFTVDGSTSNPNFSNQSGLLIQLVSTNGQNDTDQAGKKTYTNIRNRAIHYGAGQRFNTTNNMSCYGMGDCFGSADALVQYGGLNASGDEGTGWRTMNLTQANQLSLASLTATQPQTICNTTLTQNVTANIAAQQVTVTSTTGCNVNDWVVIERGIADLTDTKVEAVKITAVSSGVITAIFVKNHTNGGAVTPATRLVVDNNGSIGQLRYLINLSQPAYTTGTISSISGRTFTGSGATWSSNMVGGDSILPGCVAMAADDYTSQPFASNYVLRSWYPIQSASGTSMNITLRSGLGTVSYSGLGPGSGAYTVRPCARVLNFDSNGNILILETNSFTWTVGDAVEGAIAVSGDVSGEIMRLGWYTPGTSLRGVYTAVNEGAQTFASAFRASAQMTVSNATAFVSGLSLEAQMKNGIDMSGATTSGLAMDMRQAPGDNKAIHWKGQSDAAIYADPGTGDFVLARNYSGTGPKFTLSQASNGGILQGSLIVSSNTNNKVRIENLASASTSFEFRNVQNGAVQPAAPALDLFSDIVNRTLLEVSGFGQIGINSAAASTLSSNAPSFYLSQAFETFNGISSDLRYVYFRAVPDAGIRSSGGNAPVEWQISGTQSNSGLSPIFAGIKNTGVFRFGDPSKGLVSLDASTVTVARSLTLPDATGLVALATTPGTSGTAPNWTLTAGLNIPLAASGGVTAGLLGNSDYLTFTAKENALTFLSPISRSGNTISCSTCEVTSNKNIASGYAGLTGAGRLVVSQGQKVWAATDLTTYTSTSGSGTTALQTTISSPVSGQLLTYNGSDWVNQTMAGVGPHSLLSTTHSDTTPASVVRGDIIAGQGATTTWQRLALGTSGRYLRSNGTDLAYSLIAAGGAGACASNQWISASNDNSAPTCAQPAFSNLSGSATSGQLPSALVYNNQANTYSTGLQDFGAATAVLPKSADPATPANGQVWINSGALKYRDNSGAPATQVVEVQSNKNAANGYAGLTASSVLAAAQFPALTGDVTTTAGSLTATLPNIVTAATNTRITYNAKGQVTFGAQAQFTDLGGTLGSTQFPALTGDVTTTAGSLATTLASVVTAGTNTKITYNAKGLVTAGAQAQFTDIGGTLGGTQFPALTGDVTTTAGSLATTLPNIVTAGTNTKITYNAKGQVTAGAQAQLSDIGGTLQASQEPAHTGDVTNTAGSLALTIANVVTAGTNTKITYNAKGQVTAGATAAASDLTNGTTGSGSIVLAASPVVTDLTANQNANGDDTIAGKRKTDTSPTGNFQHFQNAAGTTDLWTVDVTGSLQAGTVPGARVSGSIAGNAGTATALASTPTQCGTNNFATGIAASGNANCAQPAASNLSNGTTGSGSVVLAASPTITGALGGNLDFGGNALVTEVANDTTTGTGANQLAKLTGATSAAIKMATSDMSGSVGIVVGGNGTSGNAQLARAGKASCAFDGATIAGDYVQISSSVAGDCHDTGSALLPLSGQVIGIVLSTNGSAGTYPVQVFSPGIQASPRIIAAGLNATATLASGLTNFSFGIGTSSLNATEATRQAISPVAGTASNFYCGTQTAQSAGGTLVFVLRKNSADTSLTISVPASAAAGSFSDLTHSVAIAAGDLLAIKTVNNGSGTSAAILPCTYIIQ